jgi:drug/metabolite transporter (DMT)-like permease
MTNIILYLTTVLIWGTTWYGIKLQLTGVPIEWSLVYRFGLATGLLFAFCLLTGRRLRFPVSDHKLFITLGLFLFSVNYYLSYRGVEFLTSGLVAVVFSTLSIMNILNAAVFLKRPLEPRVLAASLMGLSGIALIFWPELEFFSLADGTLVGLGLALLGTWLASIGNITAATDQAKALPLVQLNAWGMFYGMLLITSYTLTTGVPFAFDRSIAYLGSLIYLAVFGTIVAFLCFLRLIARIGAERAGYNAIGWPVVALLISTALEGYHWTAPALAGLLMVLGGNVMVLRLRAQGHPERQEKLGQTI